MTSQLEQLLTCCICLDRFRNPKLLPCQHSVCMEPCMEGLVDYVRRQVKCPECRAEHRIPYNGVQGFPCNVTLQRFLEAHIEITGEVPDPFTGQIMVRCGVCNEKNYVTTCAHCEKKICEDCKAAHGDILKREIGRINNQVKRAVHRLSDQRVIIDRNMVSLKHNSDSVTEEIENITKRLVKSIRDRGDFLRNEVINYYNTEHRSMTLLKESLEQEISNVESNIDLAEKHMDDQTNWDDCELMDTKDIFLRTMEFIRNFDYEGGDYNRRAKFNPPDDLNKLASSLSRMGELNIGNQRPALEGYGLGVSSSLPTGLMKSKSDHRLAVQFRDQEESGYNYNSGKTSPVSRRRFGDRPVINHEDSSYDSPSTDVGRRRFRSRFIRHEDEEEKSPKYDEEPQKSSRVRVIDTEDVSRGPLSGILKMYDSPRVIQRLQEKETAPKKKKEEPPKAAPVVTPKPVTFGTPRKTARQISNEDEIDKIKKQNKVEATPPSTSSVTPKPTIERLTSIKDTERPGRLDRTSNPPHSASHTDDNSPSRSSYASNKYESSSTRKTSSESSPTQKTFPFSRSSSNSSVADTNKSSATRPKSTDIHDRVSSRSDSTDSNMSTDGVVSSKSSLSHSRPSTTKPTTPTSASEKGAGGSMRYNSRFLARPGTPSAELNKDSKESGNEDDDDEETSEESDSEESEESSEEEEEEEEKDSAPSYSLTGRGTFSNTAKKDYTTTTPPANDSGYGSSSSNSRYGTSLDSGNKRRPSYLDSTKPPPKEKEDEFDSKFPYASKFLNRSKAQPEEDSKSPFHSRFLNKSKSSAILGPDKVDTEEETPSTGASRARFEELKERRQRLARSKSSAGMDEDEQTTTTEPTSSYKSRYGRDAEQTTTPPSASRLSNSNTSTTATAATSGDSTEPNQLSNWARYLKNKYGNKPSSGPTSPGTTGPPAAAASSNTNSSFDSSSSSTSRALARSRSSHLLGMAKDNTSTDDDSKNECATPTSQAVGTLGPTPFGNIHRSQYLQKQKLLFKIGSRGSEPKHFTWPRGIAVGPDNTIVVADSSNHRVQVFDSEGNFIKMFGSYGNGEGEFDCLSGVAVNRIGQFIIADRYNHRIQIFDPSGMFLRTFGCQGSGDGKFSYPWGVTTDSLGFIYVCDKENHRVQVFQSDGVFVGKFGTMGNKVSQLEHPHYIAVSSTNRVIVSDSNNHRIQIFDINGKVLTTFGEEGGDESQFKFPRGVAVDEQGYIFVADSGNNRIQIFNPEGTFIRAFGCWGSGDGEFKGLEGVAVMSNGNILICDRENHRVQVF